MDAVVTNFIERRGVISSRNKETPLFDVKGEMLNNVYDDLSAFWYFTCRVYLLYVYVFVFRVLYVTF